MMLVRFILAMLATWRVTHLIAKEDGPWNLIVRIRRRLGNGWWGALMDCFNCLSLWIALPFAGFVGNTAVEFLISWLALSGGAILVEEHIRDPFAVQGDANGMLRPTKAGNGDHFQDQAGERPTAPH